MILQNLTVGARITMEVVWGEAKYEIPTTVAFVHEDSIWINAFSYKGTVLDLGSTQFRDMMYNIYAIDPANGSRFVWKNVNIDIVASKGESYYEVRVNTFGRFGNLSERRADNRISVNVEGRVTISNAKETKRIYVHDISNNGISFVSSKKLETAGSLLKVEFRDQVKEHGFHLVQPCICVRETAYHGKYLYGCKITEVDKNMLVYACLKKMESNAVLRGTETEPEPEKEEAGTV